MAATSDERIAHLERRVDELERRLAGGAVATAPVRGEPACDELETNIGLSWLNRAGAALVLAGLAFAAVWANERGYLSPALREALLAGAAAAVLVVGVILLAGDTWRRRFALGVAAVGCFGLYLVPFTAAHVDALFSPAVAGGLSAGLTVALAAVAGPLRAPELSTYAMVGALTIPITGEADAWGYAGPALAAALYLVAAVGGRAMRYAENGAVLAAAAIAAGVAYGHTESPGAFAVVGALAAGAAAILRARAADPAARQLMVSIAVVLTGAAWVLTAARWTGDGPAAAVAVSGAMVAYGLGLLAAGIAWSSGLCRLFGVTILGVAALKLVLHDIWSLPIGFRVAGLFVLGAGLLAASFLYSRYAAR